MPFYFANPRRGISRTQGGEGRKDRQRTAPSLFVYYVLAPVTVLFALFMAYLPVIGNLVIMTTDGKTSGTATLASGSPKALRTKDRIPIKLPGVLICFKGRPNGDDLALLEEWELEPERIANIRKDVFLLRNPTMDQYRKIVDFSGLDRGIRPPAEYITVNAIPALIEIVSAISMISRCLWLNKEGGLKTDVEFDKKDVTGGTEPQPERQGGFGDDTGDVHMEEGEVSPSLLRLGMADPTFTLSVLDVQMDKLVPWGTAEQLLARPDIGGIMCPFEENFAGPDPHAINALIAMAPWLFVSDSDDTDSLEEIMGYWITEIASTRCGLVIAHMISSISAAVKAQSSVFFLQFPERHYDGAVIVGSGFTFGGPAIDTAKALDADELTQELKDYGYHTVTLRKILDLCGCVAVNPDAVMSMRHLREIVYAGTGAPTGVIQNQVMKLLPKLSFGESPLGVNAKTVMDILWLLSNSDDIPRNLFMPTECFFTPEVERTKLVLCAWGNNPPTFNYSGKPLLVTVTKGIGAGNIDQYSATPPRVLQMKRVAMQNAVAGWNTMLDKGYIWGDYDNRTRGSRVFAGKDKIDLWRGFNEVISSTVKRAAPTGIDDLAKDAPRGMKRFQDDPPEKERKEKKGRLFRD